MLDLLIEFHKEWLNHYKLSCDLEMNNPHQDKLQKQMEDLINSLEEISKDLPADS